MTKIKDELKKMWSGEKTKPLANLLIYTVVILALFGIYLLVGKSNIFPLTNQPVNKPEKEQETDPLAGIKEQLKAGNFRYRYEITINDQQIIYEGKQTTKINEGYKEELSGTIKYYITDNSIYEVKLGKLYPYTELYQNIDYNLINLDTVLALTPNQKEQSNTVSDPYLYETSYQNQLLTWQIKVDSEEQVTIIIKSELFTYQLNYFDIGQITENQFGSYPMASESGVINE